ncbi:MAG: lipid-A-disaccharide synthase, partial [Nitrospirales bacterium]|nr:lipid-A-disaccharide synthase [Nitrospirales bacterium]
IKPFYDKNRERAALGFEAGDFVLGLFPGSRRSEIREILPVLLRSLPLLKGQFSSFKVVLAQAHSLPDAVIQDILKESVIPIRVIKEHPYRVMAISDFLLMASGTATLQAALVGTPMVIVYRVNILTYLIAKLLVTINSIGLVNILAGREVAPELIQGRMTPDRIAGEVVHLLTHPDRLSRMRKAFEEIRSMLGGPGASRRAAEIILADLRPRP